MSDQEAATTAAQGDQPTPKEPFRTGQTIILGFTGSLGSGCTFLAEGMKECLGADGHHYRLSKYIRDSLRQQGTESPTTTQMQDEGNRLRKEHGLEYLVAQCIEEATKRENEGSLDENSMILIDGIRNTSYND